MPFKFLENAKCSTCQGQHFAIKFHQTISVLSARYLTWLGDWLFEIWNITKLILFAPSKASILLSHTHTANQECQCRYLSVPLFKLFLPFVFTNNILCCFIFSLYNSTDLCVLSSFFDDQFENGRC